MVRIRDYKLSYFVCREQVRKKAEEDLNENIDVIRRNLPAKKDGIAGYLSQTTQEIADQIARHSALSKNLIIKEWTSPYYASQVF